VNLHKGSASAWPIAVAAFILSAIAFAIAPQPKEPNDTDVSFDQVRNIIDARCATTRFATLSMHAARAVIRPRRHIPRSQWRRSGSRSTMMSKSSMTQIESTSRQCLRVMPIGNLTAMTDEERQVIDAWYQELKKSR
jgi:uncharacterized membrane protein